jgi:hypothetical protein
LSIPLILWEGYHKGQPPIKIITNISRRALTEIEENIYLCGKETFKLKVVK